MSFRYRVIAFASLTTSLILGVGSAHAAPTETVTNLNDSGSGSLRQALTDVDADGSVAFNSSLSGTIDLQTALEVDKSFTLTGPGADKVTIDANNRDNILVIGSNTPGNYAVEVEGLTFFRGAARNPDAVSPTTWRSGGGIAFVSGLALTVRDSVFRQNLSSGTDFFTTTQGGGGGIAMEGCTGSFDGATLTIESSYFVRNGSYNRGGGAVSMYSKRDLTITDTEFRNNVGEGGDGGGALLVAPRYTNADPACVSFNNNERPSTAPVTITDSLFRGNGGQADSDGPAISIMRGTGPKTVEQTEFRNNGGDGDAGAIYDDSASPMLVEDSLFRFNGVEDEGGAIHTDAGYGGPLFTDAFLLDVVDSAFTGNSAEGDGGAIYYDPDYFGPTPGPEMELSVTGTEFIGNSSQDGGAGIYNSMQGGEGSKPILHVSDSLFEDNYTYGSGEGSAIDFDASNGGSVLGEVEILDTVVNSNSGGEGGTPIQLDGAPANTVMNNVSVTNNVVGDNDEAGIVLSNATITPTDCTDPALVRSQYDLSNITVAGNAVAETNNGSVRLEECGSLDLDSSTIALNAIAGNDGDGTGTAGLRVDSDSVATVRNSIIAMNSYSSNGTPSNQSDCYLVPGGTLAFEDANLVGSLTGCEAATGAPLTGDPGFAEFDPVEVQNIQTGDDTFIVPLAADSQARGAALGDWPETDQRGATRPGTAADLGAVQFYEEVGLRVFKTGNGDGSVTSDLGEIECGGICEATYPEGTTVTLTATPDAGSAFRGWDGGCSGSGLTCSVTVDQAETVNANFTLGGSGGGNANIQVVPAGKRVLKVGKNRSLAVAKVTCKVGTCKVNRVSGLQLGIRRKQFKPQAILPKGTFVAGQTRTIGVRIPKRAYSRLLRTRKSGTLRLASFSVANDSAGKVRMKVYRNFEFKLRRR